MARMFLSGWGQQLSANIGVRCRKRLPAKVKFFTALHRRMQDVRTQTSLPVVLVGDLNISHRPEDVHPMRRWVNVDDMLADA